MKNTTGPNPLSDAQPGHRKVRSFVLREGRLTRAQARAAVEVDGHTLEALGNTLLLSGAAALGVLALAALAVMTRRGRAAGLTGSVLSLTFALPGSTLAIASTAKPCAPSTSRSSRGV